MIPNPTIADAILDRLVHNAHRLVLNGDSVRNTAAKRKLDVKSQSSYQRRREAVSGFVELLSGIDRNHCPASSEYAHAA